MAKDEESWDSERNLEKVLANTMVLAKQKLWQDIEVAFEKFNFDLAYFKVHLILKLSVEKANREPATITVEQETDEPLGGE